MRNAILLGAVLLALAGIMAAPAATAVTCYQNDTLALAGAYASTSKAHVEAGPVAITCEYDLPP